tara:strand:+ start:212 stop:661 length:450 start_codon:yes stop_codon:yes gene_type:complete
LRILKKIIIIIFTSSILLNCSNSNHTKIDTKIHDYESSGSPTMALSLGSPAAALLFITIDISNYLKFNLNEKELNLHTNAIYLALNNSPNGKIVSWHNNDRYSSGKVRVVKTYYKNGKYCRIFQSLIKLNGAKKHVTKHVCKINNVWKF